MSEDETAGVQIGFVGPLTEANQDRCPLCGLDPLDDTLHAPWCRTVTEDLCGVIHVGRICLKKHGPGSPDWARTHEWVDIDDAPTAPDQTGCSHPSWVEDGDEDGGTDVWHCETCGSVDPSSSPSGKPTAPDQTGGV